MKAFKLITVATACALMAGIAIADNTSTNNSNPWLVRIRGIYVQPELSSGSLSGLPSIQVANVAPAADPELDINYFFTPNWSSELILATTKHNVDASNGIDLGSVWLLPPTLTGLYHFFPNSLISPYVGAGINYTWFYNVDSGPVASQLSYDDAFGPVLQVGFDVNMNSHWSFNMDVKKVFLKTRAFATIAGTQHSVDVTLDPWIFGTGVGYRF